MSRFQVERSLVWKILLGTVACTVGVTAYLRRADAQSTPDECALAGKNCSFTISNNAIQKVPTLFKLQSQISQAKIPVGDAVFTKLVVNVKSGNTQLCNESFNQVRVRSGVLNLEIGRNIQGCQLDDIVAKYNDLAFQVCIGDSSAEAGNCLKPIQLGSVPYAIKASFASQAQESYRSEIAARANYAQRLVADGTRLDQTKLGLGYYDFETPASNKLTTLTAVLPAQAADVKGGFMQWTAVDPLNKILNVSAKNSSTGVLEPLTKLLIHATDTNLWGKLAVNNTSNFVKQSTFVEGYQVTGGSVTINAPTSVTKQVTMSNSLTVIGNSSVATVTAAGLITANAGAKVTSGSLDVQTSASFGKAGLSTSLAVQPGTTVDFSQATNVLMPPNQPAPAFPIQQLSANSPAGCTTATAVGARFCGISMVRPLAVGALNGCWISNTPSGQPTGLILTACSANCQASCF